MLGGAVAVIFTSDDGQLASALLVGDGSIEDEGCFSHLCGRDVVIGSGDVRVSKILSVSARSIGRHRIIEARVVEGAPYHQVVVFIVGGEVTERRFFSPILLD